MTKLFICNIPFAVEDAHLFECFSQYGPVERAQIARHTSGERQGQSRGFAFVEMADADAAQAAIDGLNGALWGDRTVGVRLADDRHERPTFEQAQGER